MATLGGIRHLSLARPHHLQLLRQLLHLHFQGFDILMNIHVLCTLRIVKPLPKEFFNLQTFYWISFLCQQLQVYLHLYILKFNSEIFFSAPTLLRYSNIVYYTIL